MALLAVHLVQAQTEPTPVRSRDSLRIDSVIPLDKVQPIDTVLSTARTDSVPDNPRKERKAERRRQRLEARNLKANELIIVPDSLDPLAPSRAAFASALVPGLGQVYNKRYWKVPLVYGAIGTGVYAYAWNNQQYNRYRDAFKSRRAGFTTDEFYDINGSGTGPDVSDEALQDAQVRFQKDRDLSLLLTLLAYALNIIDANVDAHLKQYNVSEKLAWDLKPQLYVDPVFNEPVYGIALEFEF